MHKLRVVLRTCSRINAFSGPDRDVAEIVDYGVYTKEDYMFGCIRSLVSSIDLAKIRQSRTKIVFTIVDDHSSDNMTDYLRAIADEFIAMDDTGNGPSQAVCFNYGKQYPDDVSLFIEDDYLCHPGMVYELIAFYEIAKEILEGREPCLHPTDDPARYKTAMPSFIVMGDGCHWRTIDKTTSTFMVKGSVLHQFWPAYEALTKYGIDPTVSEDNTINLLYKDLLPCFSPIPSLALHLQYDWTISPFVDPITWWLKYGSQETKSS